MGQADYIWVQMGIALTMIVALIALPVAIVISLALIRLFRWRVGRSMRIAAGVPQDPATRAGDGGKGTLAIEGIEPTGTRGEALPPLLGDVWRRSCELAAIHAEAACLYLLLFTFLWWRPHGITVLHTAALFGLWAALLGTPVVFAGMMVFTKQPGLLALSASALVSVLFAFDLATAADVYPMLYIGAAVPLVAVLMLMILRREPRLVIFLVLAMVILLLAFIPIWGRGSKAGTDLVGLWFMGAGMPTLAVVLLSLRRFRAVGPPVFASMLLFLVGIVIGGSYATFFFLDAIGAQFVRADLAQRPLLDALLSLSPPELLAIMRAVTEGDGASVYRYDPEKWTLWVNLQSIGIFVLATALGAVAAWAVVPWLAGTYRRRRASDQMLAIDVMMLIFLVWNVALLTGGRESELLGAIGLSSFAGYKLWTRWRLRSWRQRMPAASPRTLLLLRVFGFDRRTQRLLEDVGERWRCLGPIRLIGGPDLAYATIEPHEFFDFLNGRLSRAFVKDRKDLEARLREAPVAPDPDGRFRVEEFFSHDDTWRMTVSRLAPDSDAILMDLRGFSPANQGCIFEIEQLFAGVPLSRVVFLADASTDMSFLETTLDHTWQTMPTHSPNAGPGRHRARILKASSQHRRTLKTLLTLLCQDFSEGAGAASCSQAVSGAASA